MSEQEALVTVLYGPYESCGLVQHRTYRLQGIQAALAARGYRCALKETRERRRVELLVRGRLVFSCDITSLEFGGTVDWTLYVKRRFWLWKTLSKDTH